MFDLSAEARAYATDDALQWKKLDGRTILVTGATGLVGSTVARQLLERNRACGAGIRVVCLVRDAKKLRRVLEGYGPDDGLSFVEADLCGIRASDVAPDYVVHAACPTASAYFVSHPVETADAIVGGTRHLLELARAWGVRGFAYVSSMEVYGAGNDAPGLERLLTESDGGALDSSAVRSCYPEAKRMAEQYCCAFAAEYGVSATVIRLAQTFGPGVAPDDGRVFAMMARCAMAGEDIVLHTTGASTRMYLYTADAASAILTALTEGEPGGVYNAANPDTYSSVRDMAEFVAGLSSVELVAVRCEVDPNAPYPPEHHLPLDVSRLQALGWAPRVSFADMYRNLMASFED